MSYPGSYINGGGFGMNYWQTMSLGTLGSDDGPGAGRKNLAPRGSSSLTTHDIEGA